MIAKKISLILISQASCNMLHWDLNRDKQNVNCIENDKAQHGCIIESAQESMKLEKGYRQVCLGEFGHSYFCGPPPIRGFAWSWGWTYELEVRTRTYRDDSAQDARTFTTWELVNILKSEPVTAGSNFELDIAWLRSEGNLYAKESVSLVQEIDGLHYLRGQDFGNGSQVEAKVFNCVVEADCRSLTSVLTSIYIDRSINFCHLILTFEFQSSPDMPLLLKEIKTRPCEP